MKALLLAALAALPIGAASPADARFYGLRAFSSGAATAGAYAARIYGDGASGDAATSVYADIRVKADGTLDLANAALSSGGTGSIAPGAGSVTTNPCFGGDGTCRVGILYDQSKQTSVASLSGLTAVQATAANRPFFFQTCSNDTSVPNSLTKPCFASNSSASLTLVDNSAQSFNQPFTVIAFLAKTSDATATIANFGGNVWLSATGASGSLQAYAGTAVNLTAKADPSFEGVGLFFNSPNSPSGFAAIEGSTVSSNLAAGANAPTAPLTLLGQANIAMTELGTFTGNSTLSASQLAAFSTQQDAFYKPSYVGPTDVASSDGLTTDGFWGLRAASNAAATQGVKAIQLIGDGTTVATTVATDVLLNADGSLNLTAAYATGGACAGGDGTCFVYIYYDQNGEVAGTTQYPATAGAKNSTYAARFYKNCPSASVTTNGSTALPCSFVAAGNTGQYATTLKALTQPIIFSNVSERIQNASGTYSTGFPMAAQNGIAYSYGTNNGTFSVNGGTQVNLTGNATDIHFNALSNMFNGTTSGLQLNGNSSFLAPSQGTTNISTAVFLWSAAGSGPLFGYGNEWAVYSGSWTQAQALAYNKNLSAYWNLGF